MSRLLLVIIPHQQLIGAFSHEREPADPKNERRQHPQDTNTIWLFRVRSPESRILGKFRNGEVVCFVSVTRRFFSVPRRFRAKHTWKPCKLLKVQCWELLIVGKFLTLCYAFRMYTGLILLNMKEQYSEGFGLGLRVGLKRIALKC